MSPENIQGVECNLGRHPDNVVDAVKIGQFFNISATLPDRMWQRPEAVVEPTEFDPTFPEMWDRGR